MLIIKLVDILLPCWSRYNKALGVAMAAVFTEREHKRSCS